MHHHTPRRHPGLMLAGTVLFIGSACSKGADQRPPADSGTSTAAVSPDTGGTSADANSAPVDSTGSKSAVGSDSTSQARTSSTSVAAPVKPRVRPNIDPG